MSESEQSNTSNDDEVVERVQPTEEHANVEEHEQQQPEPEDDSSSMSSTTSSSSSSENEEEKDATEEVVEKVAEVQDTDQYEDENKETIEHGGEDNDDDEDGIFTTRDDEPVEHVPDESGDDYQQQRQQHLDEDEQEEHVDDEEEREDVEDSAEAMRIMQRMEVSDDEDEEVDTGPNKIDLEMTRCKAELGEEGPYFVKLPNFLSIETRPFDPETYDDELDEDEMQDRRARLKLKLGNTIRWRIVRDEQGNEKRESNARVVRWSDGSMSLFLGKEIFEIEKQSVDKNNHLYIRQGSALQAQSVFGEKLVFRPHSTETLTHRKMTEKMAEKTSKTQKVRVLANVGENPEAQKRELIRLEEEKLRAAARREAQQRRVRERPRNFGLTQGFLEGYDSDEGAESIAAIKRRYQHAPYGMGDHHREGSLSESDEEREEQRQRRNINEAKIDSEEEGDEVMDASDTESRQKQQQKKKILIEEDEED